MFEQWISKTDDHIKFQICIPKKVYAPGEQMKLSIEITNNSPINVDSVNTGIIALAYCKGQAVFGKTEPITKEETETIKSQEEVLEDKIMVTFCFEFFEY